MGKPKKDHPPGSKFGRLTVVEEIEPVDKVVHGYTRRRFLFECECGTRIKAVWGKSDSCGCLQREVVFKHGYASGGATYEYRAYHSMLTRCNSHRSLKFKLYGGRGIKVCKRWLKSFENFLEDMGPRPAGMTLERKDSNGDYTPENCKWADRIEQANNRRISHKITVDGRTLSLSQWSREVGISPSTLGYRLSQGWSPEKALGKVPQGRDN